MATKIVTLRMDEQLKETSEKLFAELGLNMTTAITAFVKQAIREQRIPFDITLNVPNMTTLAAIIESERLLSDPETKRFSTVEDLFKDLDN